MRRYLVSVVSAAVVAALAVAPAGGDDACRRWSARVVAEGLGTLENLEPDGTGGMLVSVSPRDAIDRIAPDGSATTVVSDIPNPGGLRVRGGTLHATTNNHVAYGLLGIANGTVERIDLATGERETYSAGLTMPNGLVFTPNGDAFTSRDLGVDAKIARIPAADPANPDTAWADLGDTNGLAIDPTRTWLYVSTTFNPEAAVYRVRLDDPATIELVAELGGPLDPLNGLDDMTIDRQGVLYITANGMGRVWRLDPQTGERCIIAEGLGNPSAVKFGRGPGWPQTNLYVTGFDGRLVELTPPDG